MLQRAVLYVSAIVLLVFLGLATARATRTTDVGDVAGNAPSVVPASDDETSGDTVAEETSDEEVVARSDDAATTSRNAAPMPLTDEVFEPVIQRLIADGWQERWVREQFADDRTEFIPKMAVVKPKTSPSSSSSNAYRWVNTDESARACIDFINKYSDIFDTAEKRYGVPREMIAALMRVETRHGKVTGDYHVFSVYASMALLTDPDRLAENLKNAKETLSDARASKSAIADGLDYVRSRSESRGNWAYRELVDLLRIQKEGRLESLGIYGSWAGAFGWTQFLPSSYLRSGVDGDGDGTVDLFTPADAINSVANYLNQAGFKAGSTRHMRKALYNYNNSSAYVNSIMGLYSRVKRML